MEPSVDGRGMLSVGGHFGVRKDEISGVYTLLWACAGIAEYVTKPYIFPQLDVGNPVSLGGIHDLDNR